LYSWGFESWLEKLEARREIGPTRRNIKKLDSIKYWL